MATTILSHNDVTVAPNSPLVIEVSAANRNQDAGVDFEISLQRLQEEALLPIIEDLADWLSHLFDIEINNDNFLCEIDNGVILCRLVQLIQSKMNSNRRTKSNKSLTSNEPIHYRPKANRGTWFARDNIATFLSFCEKIGVKKSCMFETENLVQHSCTRSIVLCLLEVARVVGDLGLPSPSLIAIENEISIQEIKLVKNTRGVLQERKLDNADNRIKRSTPVKLVKSFSITAAPAPTIPAPINIAPSTPLLPAAPEIPVAVQRSTSSASSSSTGTTACADDLSSVSSSSVSSKKRKSNRSLGEDDNKPVFQGYLEIEMQRLAKECTCSPRYDCHRIQEGLYSIMGKRVFIRLLNEKHWMLRVGGGWTTLAAYIAGHDPCRRPRLGHRK